MTFQVEIGPELLVKMLTTGYSEAATCFKGLPEGSELRAVWRQPFADDIFLIFEAPGEMGFERLSPCYRLWSKAEALAYAERALT